MTNQITRREALRATAGMSAGLWLGVSAGRARAASPNEKLNVAVIGIGGRGRANLNAIGATENIVALCDVDEKRAGNAFEKFPRARTFHDFRRMLQQMENSIDAVVVNTPDHVHFHPSMMAMEMGKHLYCEKPMAHNVWEVRQMTELAKKNNLATQLGMQRHAYDNMHRVTELIQSGAIGDVSQVHSWVGGDRGMPALPKQSSPVPAHLKWDLWIGPAKFREYAEYKPGEGVIAPYNWRFWWDYGTGETGNWGCHILDIPFAALDLKYPTRVDASGPPVDKQLASKSMTTRFAFPANERRPEVELHWYHAKDGPPILKELGLNGDGANTLFIGTKGLLLCGFNLRKLLPEEQFENFKAPEKSVPDSPGFHNEWTEACKGGEPATCNFDYSGPLAETVLLGNTAYRAEGGFDWDAKELSTNGNSPAQALIRTSYRKGWEI